MHGYREAPPLPAKEEVEKLPEGRDAVRKIALLAGDIQGYEHSVDFQAGEYVKDHQDLPVEIRELLMNISERTYRFGRQLEKLLPRVIGMSEEEFIDMLIEINHEVEPHMHIKPPESSV